eukprot:11348631-Alexandrium_andersonii.AAC.1
MKVHVLQTGARNISPPGRGAFNLTWPPHGRRIARISPGPIRNSRAPIGEALGGDQPQGALSRKTTPRAR